MRPRLHPTDARHAILIKVTLTGTDGVQGRLTVVSNGWFEVGTKVA